MKNCPNCKMSVDEHADRCPHCTSQLYDRINSNKILFWIAVIVTVWICIKWGT
jgi:uncharacterized paraquat-inducible protein A